MAERDENVVPVYDVPGREQSVLVDHIVEQADGLVGARMVTFESTGVSRYSTTLRRGSRPMCCSSPVPIHELILR